MVQLRDLIVRVFTGHDFQSLLPCCVLPGRPTLSTPFPSTSTSSLSFSHHFSFIFPHFFHFSNFFLLFLFPGGIVADVIAAARPGASLKLVQDRDETLQLILSRVEQEWSTQPEAISGGCGDRCGEHFDAL